MTTSSIIPLVLNAIPVFSASIDDCDSPSFVQVAPIAPIAASTSRMLSKCCLSRCLSALLSAVLPIRLFSSARTRSLTLFLVVVSSAATGSVIVMPPLVVVSPTTFEYSVYGLRSAARTCPAPAALNEIRSAM